MVLLNYGYMKLNFIEVTKLQTIIPSNKVTLQKNFLLNLFVSPNLSSTDFFIKNKVTPSTRSLHSFNDEYLCKKRTLLGFLQII